MGVTNKLYGLGQAHKMFLFGGAITYRNDQMQNTRQGKCSKGQIGMKLYVIRT